ncbi:MAG: hypothetical protein AB7F43_02730 [Bacteriovoracia bacterium]
MFKKPKVWFWLSVLFTFKISFLTGCTSSIFTGDTSSDAKIGSGQVKSECFGLDLSEPRLTASTTRSLIDCLNSNGNIQAFADLSKEISNDELNILISYANQEVLQNPQQFQQVDLAFQQLDANGFFKDFLPLLHRILQNEEFIKSLFKTADLFGVRSASLKAVAELADDLNKDTLVASAELIQKISRLRSYRNLILGFRVATKVGLTVEDYVGDIFDYLDKSKNAISPLRTFEENLSRGDLFKVVDQFLLNSTEEGKTLSTEFQAESFAKMMEFLLVAQPKTYETLQLLFQKLNKPLMCMGDSKKIENPILLVFDQIRQIDPLDVPKWAAGSNILKMQIAKSVCDLPEDMNQLMDAFRKMADSQFHSVPIPNGSTTKPNYSLVTFAHLLRALAVGETKENQELSKALISLIGDPHGSHLTRTLQELALPSRNHFGSLLFIANALDKKDKQVVQILLKDALKTRKNLNGKSVQDVLIKELLDSDLKAIKPAFTDLVVSATNFIDSDQNYLEPLVTVARNALVANNGDSLVQLLTRGLRTAPNYEEFFRTTIGLYKKPAFVRSIRLLSEMSRNGQLKDLINGLLMMFRKKGSAPTPQVVGQPTPTPSDKDLALDDNQPWTPTTPTWNMKLAACHGLNLNQALSKPTVEQLRKLGECADANSSQSSSSKIYDFVYLTTEIKTVSNKPFLPLALEVGFDFINNQGADVLSPFGDFLTDSNKFHSLIDLTNLIPFAFKDYGSGDLARIVLDTNSIIFTQQNRDRNQKLLNLLATNVEDPNLFSSIGLMHDSYKEAKMLPQPTLPLRPPLVSYPLNKFPENFSLEEEMMLAMRIHEGVVAGSNEYHRRLNQKTYEYWNNVQSSQHWDKYNNTTHFKNELKPLLDKLAEPGILEAFLGFFFYLDRTIKDRQYCPEWVESWFTRLASQVVVLPYYYPGTFPGEHQPQVRFVSYLDILELIVNESDYTLRELGQDDWLTWVVKWGNLDEHFSIKYLSKLAQLPNSENMSNWVDEMLDELSQFTQYLPPHPLSGLMKPEVARRLYNLNQVIPFLKKFNKTNIVECSDGKIARGNDLGFLRDIFRAVISATPKDKWNEWTRKNSLSLFPTITRIGMTRNIGLNIWKYQASQSNFSTRIKAEPFANILDGFEPAVMDYSSGHVILNPDTVRILTYFLRQDCDHSANRPCSSIGGGFDQRYVTIGKIIDKLFEWTNEDTCSSRNIEQTNISRPLADTSSVCKKASIKKIFYFLGMLGGDLEKKKPGFTRTFIRSVAPTIINYSDVLTSRLDLLDDLVLDPQFANMFEVLFSAEKSAEKEKLMALIIQNVEKLDESGCSLAQAAGDFVVALLSDPQKNIDRLRSGLKSIKNDPEYQKLNLEKVSDDIIAWMKKESPLRLRFQSHLSKHLTNGNIHELLRATTTNKNSLYEKSRFFGEQSYILDVQAFLENMRTGLEPNVQQSSLSQ